MLLAGRALAAAGSAVLAATPLIAVALVGLVLAAVATTAHSGYLVGPACAGLLAEASDLRDGLFGPAALAAVFTAAAAPTSAGEAEQAPRPPRR